MSEEIKGKIVGIQLPSLLQLFEHGQKTCILKITSGRQNGHIILSEGQIISAQTPELRQEEAVIEMLAWRDIEVEIAKQDFAAKREIRQSLMQMITVYLNECRPNTISRESLELYRQKLKQARYLHG